MLVSIKDNILENGDCPFRAILGQTKAFQELIDGVYDIHLNGINDVYNLDIETFPEIQNISSYGVCDNYQQILDQEPELITSDKKYFIFLTEIRRGEQESSGGWRWHKWGQYIGGKDPQCEYLYNETDIDVVFVYSIYRIKED